LAQEKSDVEPNNKNDVQTKLSESHNLNVSVITVNIIIAVCYERQQALVNIRKNYNLYLAAEPTFEIYIQRQKSVNRFLGSAGFIL